MGVRAPSGIHNDKRTQNRLVTWREHIGVTASPEIDLGSDVRAVHDAAAVLAASFRHNGLSSRARTVVVVLSVIIKYPDTIIGRVNVTGTQPVMEVVARQGGPLGEPESARGPASETGRDFGGNAERGTAGDRLCAGGQAA